MLCEENIRSLLSCAFPVLCEIRNKYRKKEETGRKEKDEREGRERRRRRKRVREEQVEVNMEQNHEVRKNCKDQRIS